MNPTLTRPHLAIGAFLCATTLVANAAAATTTRIEVTNCAASSHHVDVFAYETSQQLTYNKNKLDPGDIGKVHCDTKKCDLEFKTSKSDKWEKDTDYSGWYVYVADNHKVSVSKTESVCSQ